jgi:hypothetical protein
LYSDILIVLLFVCLGAPRGRAPGQPPRHGHALGAEGGADFEPVTEPAEISAEAAVEEIVEVPAPEPEEQDSTLTYDQFLEQQASKLVINDVKIRAPQNDAKQWQAAKELKRTVVENDAEPVARTGGNNKKKNIVSLDEFVGSAAAPRQQNQGYQGRGGYRGK